MEQGKKRLDHIVYTAGNNLGSIPLAVTETNTITEHGILRFYAPIIIGKLVLEYINRSPLSSITFTSGVNNVKPLRGRLLMAGWGAGVEGVTRSLAVDLRPIRVDYVCPAPTRKELFDRFPDEVIQPLLEKYKRSTMTSTIGTTEDIAEAYLYGFLRPQKTSCRSGGGATGIGAALVTVLYRYGAHIIFGDINRDAGEALVSKLQSQEHRTDFDATSRGRKGLIFLFCDVCTYNDLYRLFRSAYGKHGHIDHAVFCASIVDGPTSSYLDVNLTIDTVGRELGGIRTLEVNFMATCAFARMALPFLRERAGATRDSSSSNPSLTFLSSVTSFRDSPGMILYQTSKQAILGLMRSMRTAIFARDGIRVNAVCLGMTDSPMTSSTGLIDLFKNRSSESNANLLSHYQTSTAVAQHIASFMVLAGLNGKSIYVEERKGWDFEEGLAREMPNWLGDGADKWSNENLKFLANSFGGA
ncbi:uncharacterized protein A1O9_11961 [Exophiala aquamarina CBS 119918]|uniref:Uncharacterized protein n=1 Tax=Exophiala aquamarina CBS 119918 TaxID=1182545 RepID=A0A072NWI0_9EURO|nr:uncharacterized protein A1O9_11961 [Exophiala aquamarina CBS 119918]KEF51971.1 hypothetical protein A1O9_11961 [Exophiala aquamarina CBS 119918]